MVVFLHLTDDSKFSRPVQFAIEELQVLVTMREPNNPAALIARGDAHYFLGKFEHALVDYHRARSQDNLLTKADE